MPSGRPETGERIRNGETVSEKEEGLLKRGRPAPETNGAGPETEQTDSEKEDRHLIRKKRS